MRKSLSLLALTLSFLGSTALAGPVQDFETALRATYGQYRVALFATNMGNAEKATAALAAFQEGWAALATDAASAPQYADDPALAATLTAVADHAAKADAAVAAGNLPQAHEVLEGIRAEIGALHGRNGVIGFSDRMNAYHAAMEEVLAVTPEQLDAAGMALMAERAGVLAYLAAEIAANPAPEAASAEYAPLEQAFQASVAAFVTAVRAEDAAAVAAAMGGLKAPYSKFFLSFG